jgi:4-hydroxyphenylpyruvate dioxygenase
MIQDIQAPGVRALGLEFIELTAPDGADLERFLVQMGFSAIARHRHKPVVLYRQGEINLIVNESSTGTAHELARERGVAVCALALRVDDALGAYRILLQKGAWPVETTAGVMELNIPGIEGVGGTQLLLIDRVENRPSIYDIDFEPIKPAKVPAQHLGSVSAITLTLVEGRSREWMDFFIQLFSFSEAADGRSVVCDSSGLTIHIADQPLVDDDNVGDEYISAITFLGRSLPPEVQTEAVSSANGQQRLLPNLQQPVSIDWLWEKKV